MAAALKLSDGNGTQYPQFTKVNNILGTPNIDSDLKTIAELLKKQNDKNGQALINAISSALSDQGLSTDITLRQLVYCDSYNCAKNYFKILDDLLLLNDVFFRLYKPLTDVENLYSGSAFKNYTDVYYAK